MVQPVHDDDRTGSPGEKNPGAETADPHPGLTRFRSPAVNPWRRIAALNAGFLVALMGLVVMVGWFIHQETFLQVNSGFVAMVFNTALCFFLSGAALVLVNAGQPIAAIGLSGLSGALGFLVLLEYFPGVRLGLDDLLMTPYVTTMTPNPGRMAPDTAVCFVLACAVVWSVASPRLTRIRAWLSSTLSVVVLTLGCAVFSGYLTGSAYPYGWGHLTPMAVHTAAGFCVLGAGLLLTALDREWKGWRSVGLPVVSAALLVGAARGILRWLYPG